MTPSSTPSNSTDAGTRAPDAVALALDALVPYWAAETEICRAHFARPDRSPALDASWLARQAAKELHDGVVPRVARVQALVEQGASAGRLARETEELHEEAAHLEAFARAHDVAARQAGLAPLAERDLADDVTWAANADLAVRRADHARRHGRAGELATVLTEGGCAALFAVGAGLAARAGALGDVDRAIATACAAVLADEVDHVRSGLADLAAATADGVDPHLVVDLAVAQSEARLRMRQTQFAEPVPADRFEALLAGATADVDSVERRIGRRSP